MSISELKKDAKIKLSGIYFKTIIINILYLLIISVLEMIGNLINNNILSIIYQTILLFVTLPFSYGLLVSMLKLSRSENVSLTDFINIGLQNSKKVLKVFGRLLLKIIFPIILIIISSIIFTIILIYTLYNSISTIPLIICGIILIASIVYYIAKLLSYILIFYIIYDNKDITSKEILEKSHKLMNSHKLDYILLYISFIGWYLLISVCSKILLMFVNQILAILFLGISILLLIPYISFSLINFYEELINTK